VAANLVLDGELRVLAEEFERALIEFVVLKGLPLARRLRRRLDTRALADNDLLVRRADAAHADKILRTLGYQPEGARHIEAALHDDFELAYRRPSPSGVAVTVDLHWAPFEERLYPVDEQLIWSRTEWFDNHGTPVRVFDKPLTIVHLAAHYAQHRFTEARIIDEFATAWNLWHDNIDADDLAELARQCHLEPAVAYAFATAKTRNLLTAPEPPVQSRRARALHRMYPAGRTSAAPPDRDYAGALLSWSLAPATRIPSHLAKLAFPSIETLAAMKQRPATKALYLEYAARPLRPVGRMIARAATRPRTRLSSSDPTDR